MADQDYIHTAEIMKAAVPYINSRSRSIVEFFSKALDFMGTFRQFTNSNSMAACGFENEKTDLEGLLKGIRPICNSKEQEMIDRVLSIFNAKRMFEMYNSFMSVMNTMEGFSSDNSEEGASSKSMFDFSGYNFDSIFGNHPQAENDDDIIPSEDTLDKFGASDIASTIYSASDVPDADLNTDYDNHTNAHYHTNVNSDSDTGINNTNADTDHSTNTFSDAKTSSDDQTTADSDTPSDNMNNNMLNMLKAMVPPEQMSTFENLSMLFKTMSYDSNNHDDSKE